MIRRTHINQLVRVKLTTLGRIRLGQLKPEDSLAFAFPRAKAILMRVLQTSKREKVLLSAMLGNEGPLQSYAHHIDLTNGVGVPRTLALLEAVNHSAVHFLIEIERMASVRRRNALLHAAGSEDLLKEHGDVVNRVLSNIAVRSAEWQDVLKSREAAKRFLSSASGTLPRTQFRPLVDFFDSIHHRKA